jgi:hypothetical protein
MVLKMRAPGKRTFCRTLLPSRQQSSRWSRLASGNPVHALERGFHGRSSKPTLLDPAVADLGFNLDFVCCAATGGGDQVFGSRSRRAHDAVFVANQVRRPVAPLIEGLEKRKTGLWRFPATTAFACQPSSPSEIRHQTVPEQKKPRSVASQGLSGFPGRCGTSWNVGLVAKGSLEG